MIFAHGGEEIAWLESHFIPVKVIPGITTASAMAACSRISLTHRGMASSVAFVSGHHPDIAIPRADTLVFYMGAGRIREIAIRLIRKGWHKQTPVLLVHNVSRPDQQEFFTTLDRLQESTRSYPTPLIILVGEVVRQRKEAQAAPRPRKILHTGSLVSGYDTTDEVIHQPLIAIRPVTDQAPLLQVIHRLQEFDYLLFTSRYAVRYFFEALKQAKKDSRALQGLRIASIGKVTSDVLRSKGIEPDLEAATEDSYGVIALFRAVSPGEVLIPRSDIALPILPEGLRQLGFGVICVTAYHNRLPEDVEKIDLSDITSIAFTSPSCVERFYALYGEFPDGREYLLKGKITREAFERIKQQTNTKTPITA